MGLPVISPLPDFPVVELLGVERDLQGSFFNIEEGEESGRIESQHLIEGSIVHKPKSVEIVFTELFLQRPTNPNKSEIPSFVLENQPHEFLNG